MNSPAGDPVIRVAIMADRRLFRDALAACLAAEGDLTVVGHAARPDDLLELCSLRGVDVVLMTVGAEIGPVLTAIPAIRSRHAKIRVLVVYEELSPADLAALWRTGIDTLAPMSHGLDALVMLLRRCVAQNAAPQAPATAREDGLTDREREIIALVAAGHTVCRIAELLQTSVHAVENAKRRIYRKLDVASHSQAVARAAALGIIDRAPALPPRPTRMGGTPLAILRGRDGPVMQRVVVALLGHGVPFSSEGMANGATWPSGAVGGQWSRGPQLLVLVNPEPEDWPPQGNPRTPVVLIRDGDAARLDVVDALGRGVVAVVPSERVAEDLVPALTLAADGYLTLDGGQARVVFEALAARRGEPDGGLLPELTSREGDILRSIASGHTVRQTARSLGIAEKTVENTQARLFRKLNARNRAGALAAAHALGLVEVEPVDGRSGRAGWTYSGATPAVAEEAGPARNGES